MDSGIVQAIVIGTFEIVALVIIIVGAVWRTSRKIDRVDARLEALEQREMLHHQSSAAHFKTLHAEDKALHGRVSKVDKAVGRIEGRLNGGASEG